MTSAKKAVVTGASGLLGRQVVIAFKEAHWTVVGTGFSRATGDIHRLDLNSEESVAEFITKERPEVIVHCAAERSPDKVSADPDAARKLNVQSTEALARITAQIGSTLIYISTDYVFSGREGEAPYEADTPTGPTNLYGQTKLDGEKAILGVTSAKTVVLRVPVLYGAADRNADSAVNVLVDAVWKAQEKDAKVTMDDWAQRYPTNTEDVARVVKDIAEKYAGQDSKQLPRILQFSSEDRYTKYEMCQIFADVLGLPLDGMMANKQGNDPNSATQRPYDTHLSTKALKELGIATWTQDFKDWWKHELHAVRH